MGLNVFAFQADFKPHYGHQFRISLNGKDDMFLAKSVKLPDLGFNTETKKNYGTTSLGFPVFVFAERSLELTFTLTEGFTHYDTFISALNFNVAPSYNNMKITVEELDETMVNVVRVHKFTGYLVEVNAPSFQRSGSAGYIEITAKFNIISSSIDNTFLPEKTIDTIVGGALPYSAFSADQNLDLVGTHSESGYEDFKTMLDAAIKNDEEYQNKILAAWQKYDKDNADAKKGLEDKLNDKYKDYGAQVTDAEKKQKDAQEAMNKSNESMKGISEEKQKQITEELNKTLAPTGKTVDNLSVEELTELAKNADGDTKTYLENLIAKKNLDLSNQELEKAKEAKAKQDAKEASILDKNKAANNEAPASGLSGSGYKPGKFTTYNEDGSFTVNGQTYKNMNEYNKDMQAQYQKDLAKWEKENLDENGNKKKNAIAKPNPPALNTDYELRINGLANKYNVSAVILSGVLKSHKIGSSDALSKMSDAEIQSIIAEAEKQQTSFVQTAGADTLQAMDMSWNENFAKGYSQVSRVGDKERDCSSLQYQTGAIAASLRKGENPTTGMDGKAYVAGTTDSLRKNSGGWCQKGADAMNEAYKYTGGTDIKTAKVGDVLVSSGHTVQVVAINDDGSMQVMESAGGGKGVQIETYSASQLKNYKVYYTAKDDIKTNVAPANSTEKILADEPTQPTEAPTAGGTTPQSSSDENGYASLDDISSSSRPRQQQAAPSFGASTTTEPSPTSSSSSGTAAPTASSSKAGGTGSGTVYNGESISKMSAKLMKKKQEGKTVTKEEARQLVDTRMTKESQQKFHAGWANRVYDNAMA